MSGTPEREALRADVRAMNDRVPALWWQPNQLAGANAMQSAHLELRALFDRVEVALAALATPPDTDPSGLAFEGFTGHKPLPNGKCEHRWRNRQTKVVTCRFADGWHAGQVAAIQESRAGEPDTDPSGLDVEAVLPDRDTLIRWLDSAIGHADEFRVVQVGVHSDMLRLTREYLAAIQESRARGGLDENEAAELREALRICEEWHFA